MLLANLKDYNEKTDDNTFEENIYPLESILNERII